MTTKAVKKSYISLTKPDLVRATIRGLKTETRRVMTKTNSTIGEGGDWANLCWDGTAVHKDDSLKDIEFARPAPLPFRDEGFGDHTYQYLHVPYDWAEDETIYRVYSKWEPGQLLGIKESWGITDFSQKFPGRLQVIYRGGVSDIDHPNGNDADRLWRDVDDATWQKYAFKNQWRGPRFMPAFAVRLWVVLESVRPERIQEITEDGAFAEGFRTGYGNNGLVVTRREFFQKTWDAINAGRGYSWETNPWVWVLKYRLVSSVGLQVMAP